MAPAGFLPFARANDPIEHRLLIFTVASAAVVPFLVGAAVKVRLDVLGRATLDWSDGAIGIAMLLPPIGVGWLAWIWLCRFLLRRSAGRGRLVGALHWAWGCGTVGGSAALAWVLEDLLQVAANALMVAILAPWLYWAAVLGGAVSAGLVGLGAGWATGNKKPARGRLPA